MAKDNKNKKIGEKRQNFEDNELENENEENTSQSSESNNKSTFIIYGIAIILAILIVISIIIFCFAVRKIKMNKANVNDSQQNVELNLLDKTTNFIPVEEIKINKQEILNGQTITLDKIVIEDKYLYTYFKEFIDLLKFDIYILDENNKLYSRDLTFNTSFDEYNTILRFDTIDKNIKTLKLYFVDNINKEKIFYHILLEEGYRRGEVRYLNQNIEKNLKDFDIIISNAFFSPLNTKIEYFIKNKNSNLYTIQFGSEEDDEGIYLVEGDNILRKLRDNPLIYKSQDENVYLNSMDFAGPSSFSSNLRLYLTKLYKRYPINELVYLSDVKNSNQKSFLFDNYELVIEGIGKFNDIIVVVLHGKDNHINGSTDENENKVEMILDSELVIATQTGAEITLSGSTKSSKIGTDIVFEIPPQYLSVVNSQMNTSNIKLNIKAVLVKIDDDFIDIDLSQSLNEKPIEEIDIDNKVLTAFKTRLSYKAGKIGKEFIEGFDKSVLDNDYIMKEYQPNNFLDSIYSVQILSKGFYDNNLYYVVQEQWKSSINSEDAEYTIHKVKLEKLENGEWTIVSDEFIY